MLKTMNVPRFLVSITFSNGYVYIGGGGKRDGTGRCVLCDEVELYDPSNDEWLQLASTNKKHFPMAWFKSNMFLYVVGYDGAVEVYNTLTNIWREVCILLNRRNFRYNHAIGFSDGKFEETC